jgi:hypothetical protein
MTAIPIPGSSCAAAATAAESRYRIDGPIAPSRGARVVALDAGAAEATAHVAAGEWAGARFLTCDPAANGLVLLGVGGTPVDLADQLDHADVVVMIASADSAAGCASALGRACWERGIMTAGLVLGDGLQAQQAVAALRPHARVLLPAADESDVTELLSALRA